jgi:hypothetical protein
MAVLPLLLLLLLLLLECTAALHHSCCCCCCCCDCGQQQLPRAAWTPLPAAVLGPPAR